MNILPAIAVSRWIVAAAILLSGSGMPANVEDTPSGPASASLAAGPATHVFAFGFDTIRQRYLNDVDLDDVAFEGLGGLSTIDPAITFSRQDGKRIGLRYRDRKISSLAKPAHNDPDGWAALIVGMTRDAAQRSEALRQTNNEQLYEAVFDATLSKLDIFSRYAGAQEASEHQAARDGFGGIGIRYQVAGEEVVVIEVMPETPAAEADLHVGDHLLGIDGNRTAGLDREGIAHKLRGAAGTAVSLTVKRKSGGTAQITLERRLIVPPTVTLTMKDGIALIAVASFNSATAANTTAAVRKAKAEPGFKGIVLDLRGNPGGLLDQGVLVADLFIAHGHIVSARGRHPASIQAYEAKPGDPGEDCPLVVLIDGASASAAEIVAAALQDTDRAVVVGTNSYGKGTVQTVVHMPNDGEMTLTWSRFHSPSGYALHGLGVLPALCTADDHAKAATILAPLRDPIHAPSLPVTQQIATWRASAVDDAKGRKLLRRICPASRHAGTAIDYDIARALIVDHALYARALRLTESPATASASHGKWSGNLP